MEDPQKISEALQRIRTIADTRQSHIVMSAEITRQDRELLTRNHWLQEIIKGWYMLVRPEVLPGDSTAWYANFWDFLRVYLQHHYDNNYCLSAEASLELHIGNTVMAQQVIVIVSHGGNLQKLPFDTSVLTYSDPDKLPKERIALNGLQVMPLALALCKITPTYFRNNGDNVEIALRSIRSPSEISNVILQYRFQRAAERIIGAYQFLGMQKYMDEIKRDLELGGIKASPSNPFEKSSSYLTSARYPSPYAARIELLWKKYRNTIIELFPKPTSLPQNSDEYLAKVDALYQYDAYNSLSIEGYNVTPDLIDRVKNNEWNPDIDDNDAQQRDALAARGYYEAFQSVKQTLKNILNGASPGECFAGDLSMWYQNLFAPCARANIISASQLLGYRNDRVFIRNSRHSPPPKEAVLDAMEALFKCLEEETEPSVRAVLGHYIFVYIHPYMDGNGRIARFLLNIMLASGGYPWTVVKVKKRNEYIASLETTHTQDNIELFTRFILSEINQDK